MATIALTGYMPTPGTPSWAATPAGQAAVTPAPSLASTPAPPPAAVAPPAPRPALSGPPPPSSTLASPPPAAAIAATQAQVPYGSGTNMGLLGAGSAYGANSAVGE